MRLIPQSWSPAIAISLLLSALLLATRAAGFVDPLDAPAGRSELAASTWLLDVTDAGSRLVAVGRRGHILYSDDGGENWTQAEVPVSVTLTRVFFPSAQQGWAVGHSGVILYSSDAGATWERRLDGRETPGQVSAFYEALADQGDVNAAQIREALAVNWEHGPEQPWLDLWFDNDRHGFVVGPFGLILKTDDGGQSWRPWMHRIDNPRELHLNGIAAIGDTLYLPSERGLVFRKRAEDDGFSSLQTPYAGSFFGLCGDEDLLLAFGLRGTIYASQDDAITWELVDSGVSTALTACTSDGQGGYLIAAMSGQVIAIRRDGAAVSSEPRYRAPWALAGVTMVNGNLLGVGSGGVWSATRSAP